jgi:hypothetical protein
MDLRRSDTDILLSGTLVFEWFSELDEQAAIAANFVVSSLVLIPSRS